MLSTKTPYRISFFGGGTDYKDWFSENGGSFISMGINKYCYIYCRTLPPFFPYKSRIVWSKIEQVLDNSEITHPVIREALVREKIKNIEIHHMGDLPARSGLGSSSSFSVGILHALRAIKKIEIDKKQLAIDAIDLERNTLNEAGGIQDQIAASFGGFNYVEIKKSGDFIINKIRLPKCQRKQFEASILLIFTGIFRNSFEVAQDQIKNFSKRTKELEKISSITKDAKSVLDSNDFIRDFGSLLNETWRYKKQLSSKVSNSVIDEIYTEALSAGAYGGKLLGAGAGGFMVVVAPSNRIENIKNRLNKLIHVPIKIDESGTELSNEKFE